VGDLSQRQGVAQSPPRPSIPLLSATSSSASEGPISFDSAAATRLGPKGASITSRRRPRPLRVADRDPSTCFWPCWADSSGTARVQRPKTSAPPAT